LLLRGVRVTARPGLLFVVSGPSGAGKDTLLEALRERVPGLHYSVSATTRAPRAEERDGEHYFFLSREEFERRRGTDGFLEWREYNGNLYGTPRDYVERTLAGGDDLVVKPEVNGALAVKAAYPNAVLVFLVPDGFANLRLRLVARGTDSGDEIDSRLAIAREELKFADRFDYLVVNEQGRAGAAISSVAAILEAEHHRTNRYDEAALARLQSE
jgi:guanylate kinase